MKNLNNILYPGTSIWESDVWSKDVIFESVIPEPEIKKWDFHEINVYSKTHTYPFEHEGRSGSVDITHYGPIDPKKPVNYEDGDEEHPGAIGISFSFGKDKYKSIDKEKYSKEARTAIGSKIKGIVEHHITTHGKAFADEMKQHGIQTFLRAEAYEPGAQNNPKAYAAAKAKHKAYGNMFNFLGKKYKSMFHPYKKPDDTGYEDIVGAFPHHRLNYK